MGGERNSTPRALSTRCGAATDATIGGRYSNTVHIGRDRLRYAADAHAIGHPRRALNVHTSRDQEPLHWSSVPVTGLAVALWVSSYS